MKNTAVYTLRKFGQTAFYRFWLGLAGLGVLTACGADGEPISPGVAVSGEVQVGVSN